MVARTLQEILTDLSGRVQRLERRKFPRPTAGTATAGLVSRLTLQLAPTTAVAANAVVPFGTIIENVGGWTVAGGAGTCKVAGRYLITAQVRQSTAVTGGMVLQRNGTTVSYSLSSDPAANTGWIITTLVTLAVNDVVRVANGGSAFTSQSGNNIGLGSSVLQIERVGN
jgi:hypothetical protein